MFMIDVGTLYWESKTYIRTAVLAYAPFTKLKLLRNYTHAHSITKPRSIRLGSRLGPC